MTTGDSRNPIGTTIAGRYELRAILGRGGMASVYRAYQGTLDREVAVKLIDPQLEADPTFSERFRLEARIVARLRHPNILTIYDFGEEHGVLFLVTELIEGGTLQERLGEIQSFAQALDVVEQVGRALDYAHSQGIVHRDVKPANVFLEGDRAILADFGIAKVIAGMTDAGLTATGTGIGTPEYMAPEQLLGQPVDGRADLYALAVMLYRLVAGRLPYRLEGPQDTTFALVMRKVNGPPPAPSAFNPVISSTLDAILLRALARDPQDRYPTAAALAAAVRGALGLGTARVTTPGESLHTTSTTSLPTIATPPSGPLVTSLTPPANVTPGPAPYQPTSEPPFQPPPYQYQPTPQPTYQPPYQPPPSQDQGRGVPYPPVPPRRAAPLGMLLALVGVLAVLIIAAAGGAFVLSRNAGKDAGNGGTTGVTPSVTAPIIAGLGGTVTATPSPTVGTPPTLTPAPPTSALALSPTVPATIPVIATPPSATPTTPPSPTVAPTIPPTEPPTAVPPTEPPPTVPPPTVPPPTAIPPTVPPPTPTTPPPPPAANVRTVAQQAILGLPGTSSGVFIDLANSANNYSDDPDRILPAASLIKLPIAGAAYQRVASGQWKLNDVFTLTNADKVGGTGVLQTQPPGTTYTLDQLVETMLVYSDNTAANMITRKLGGFDPVNAFSASQGMNNTVMRRYLFDLAAQQRGTDNTTTSGDIARFLTWLQAGQIINRDISDRIRTILARRGREDKNWALLNLPNTVVALHMSGTGTGNRNDAVVVTIGNQQYILVLMVVDPNEAGMEQAIARASASIYQAMTGR